MQGTGCRLLCLLALMSAAANLFSQTSSPDLEALLARALKLHQAGQLRQAIQEYEKFLSSGPELPQVLSNLGAAYAGLGDYAKAIESYERGLRLKENDPSLYLNLGLAYYKVTDLSRAIKHFREVLNLQPENENARLLLADCYFRMGENKEVIAVLSAFADGSSENVAIAYLLGTALIRENRLQEGQKMVDRILSRGEAPEAHLLMGTAYQMAHQYPRAVEEFEKAVQMNPQLPGAHSLWGRGLMFVAERDRAREAFQKELELNPNDFSANFYIGLFLKDEQRYEKALPYFERCRRMRLDAPEVDYQIALTYLSEGEAQRAREILEGILAKTPNFVEAHVSLAKTYYRLGLKEAGDRHREIVLRLNAERQARQPGAQEDLGPAYRGDHAVDVPRPPHDNKEMEN